MAQRLAIFGLGFIGQRVCRLATAAGWPVDGFSRNGRSGPHGRTLDAGDASSVADVDVAFGRDLYDTAVVTFPPGVACSEFWELLHGRAHRRILLGTTGVYARRTDERERLTESSPVDPDHERAADERRFAERGGLLLRLCGIYGGRRNPVSWLARGRIGDEDRQVNLAHADDIAEAVLAIAGHDDPAELYNVSDGQEHTWHDISRRLVDRGWLDSPPERRPRNRRKDAFVANDRLLADAPDLSFRDFWGALEELARDWAGERS